MTPSSEMRMATQTQTSLPNSKLLSSTVSVYIFVGFSTTTLLEITAHLSKVVSADKTVGGMMIIWRVATEKLKRG